MALGETSVTELAKPFEMSVPPVSKHLKVLERACFIARNREARWRPCRLEAGPLKEAASWIEEYRRFWEQSLNRLDAYLSRSSRGQDEIENQRFRKAESEDQALRVTSWPSRPRELTRQRNSSSVDSARRAKMCEMPLPSLSP